MSGLFQPWRSALSDVFPAGNECRGIQLSKSLSKWRNTRNVVARTTFAQSGHFTELDNGHDFYAPQSFLAKDGRRIVIGWMDMWESPMPSKREGWAGCMTLARELSESNGKPYNARYMKLSRYASSINLSLPAQSAINMFCRKRASS